MPAMTDTPAVACGPLRLEGSPGFRAPAADPDALPGPRPRPVVGNALQLERRGAHLTFERWADTYGPMYRFRLGAERAVVIADPGLIGAILRHRPEAFAGRRMLARIMRELGPTGVFVAEGDDWRRQRRLVMRGLTPEAIREFFPIVRTVTGRLLAKWSGDAAAGRATDVAVDAKRFAVDVSTWLTLGVDVDTLRRPEHPLQADIEHWFDAVGRRSRLPVAYWRHLKLPADRRLDRTMARLSDFCREVVANGRRTLAREPERRTRPHTLLDALLAARDEPGSGLDDDDVVGNVYTLLFAGEDTAANAISWLLLLLATHAGPGARAIAETDAVLGARRTIEAFGDLSRLPYLEAAAVESMRLKPIAPIDAMTTLVEVDLAGLRLPPGARLLLLKRPSALDPARFADPRAFDPERWLGDHAERADDPKRAIFPFGGGPRYCPGRYLAMVELKMVATTALRNFTLSIDGDPRSIAERLTFTMGPERLPMRFAPR